MVKPAVTLYSQKMIYLLRHGETLWNRERRLQGQRDSPLTARGVAQAQENGRRLKALIEDPKDWRILSSPLGRAWQTAVLVAESLELDPNAITFDPRLMEIAYGLWEGLTYAEMEARFPSLWRARQADKWAMVVPGGESYAALAQRASAWLEGICEEDRLIVICHGGTGRVLRGHYTGLSPAETLDLIDEHTVIHALSQGRITSTRSDTPG